MEKVPVEAANPCVTATESALNCPFTCAVPKVPDADSTLPLKLPEAPDTLVVELKALAATDPAKTPELPFN